MKSTGSLKNRRHFLQSAGAIGAGLFLFPELIAAQVTDHKYGIQLYTLRDAMNKNPESTLKKVAKLGFHQLESAGYNQEKYYGMSPGQFKKFTSDLKLDHVSAHIPTGFGSPERRGTLTNDWNKALDDARKAGCKYVVCPYLEEGFREKEEHYKRLADLLNRCGEDAKNKGLTLCYHNHDFEFFRLENDFVPYDYLLAKTDPSYVRFEADLYWFYYAGQDPLTYFEKHPGRFPLWHVKDLKQGEQKTFTEVGTGVIPFKEIFAAAKIAGLKHFFIEQDQSTMKPIKSVELSLSNLKKMLS